MSNRASKLSQTADEQISELMELLSSRDQAALGVPCPGRDKLGDGTVGACAAHATSNYGRIAGFAVRPEVSTPKQEVRQKRWWRTAGLRSSVGHMRTHGPGMHRDMPAGADVDRAGLLDELARRRAELGALADLTDGQLDGVPAASEDMRFCDGRRTLEQVLGSALKHQGHQVDAIRAAL